MVSHVSLHLGHDSLCRPSFRLASKRPWYAFSLNCGAVSACESMASPQRLKEASYSCRKRRYSGQVIAECDGLATLNVILLLFVVLTANRTTLLMGNQATCCLIANVLRLQASSDQLPAHPEGRTRLYSIASGQRDTLPLIWRFRGKASNKVRCRKVNWSGASR